MFKLSNIRFQMSGFTVYNPSCSFFPLLCKFETRRAPDITSFNHLNFSCHPGTHALLSISIYYLFSCYTHPCPCMRDLGASHASMVHPPPSYFGMPVPGICSNSSHPVGRGMSPPSTSPSPVFTACLCLSYVRQHMYEAANVDSPPPT